MKQILLTLVLLFSLLYWLWPMEASSVGVLVLACYAVVTMFLAILEFLFDLIKNILS